ncbi:MAG: hypothetical protein AAGI30_12325 [Planctomycetota bacterium]
MFHRSTSLGASAIALIAWASPAAGSLLAQWSVSGLTGVTGISSLDASLQATPITAGAGLAELEGDEWVAASHWAGPSNLSGALFARHSFSFTLDVQEGSSIRIDQIEFAVWRDAEGPGGGYGSELAGTGEKFALALTDDDNVRNVLFAGVKKAGTSTHLASGPDMELTGRLRFDVAAWGAFSNFGRFALVPIGSSDVAVRIFGEVVGAEVPTPGTTALAVLALGFCTRRVSRSR